MAGGYYTDLYESAISPWTTLGPLAFVVSVSLLVEGNADYKRHVNDGETNNAPCVIVRRADEIEQEEGAERDDKCMHGRDVIVNINQAFYDNRRGASTHGETAQNVKVGFQKVRRMDIRQGHFVLVKNREMVPADLVLLASSNDGGSAYIETSSIDGETNLKLRTSPQLPKSILKALRGGITNMDVIEEEESGDKVSATVVTEEEETTTKAESLEEATKRITRFSALGRPDGESILEYPNYVDEMPDLPEIVMEEEAEGSDLPGPPGSPKRSRLSKSVKNMREILTTPKKPLSVNDGRYVAALTTEPPNPSVHTFQGKLTLPPFEGGGSYFDIPLGAENVLLRGAVIRNTEWVIGIAFFTGTDTKLVQNSFDTPSKFSQMDRLMNNIVIAIICMMILIISYLSTQAVIANDEKFSDLWYIGLNKNTTEKWPYLDDLEAPKWETSTPNWIQFFLLYCTLLSNFVPLSLYVTLEFITFCMLAFIYTDLNMYDDTTNTRAVARSTIVTDLGRIQYIFSDKTGTLTQNVMRFKRCSVDGMAFGAPIQKQRPKSDDANADLDDDPVEETSFHPLRHLLVGQMQRPGLETLGANYELGSGERLTFNAEMFLRVMCLCHTVVVEKDIDSKEYISSGYSVQSATSSSSRGLLGFRRKNSAGPGGLMSPLSVVSEDGEMVEQGGTPSRRRADTGGSFAPGHGPETVKAADGAPYGYAYQAESPDEGALVSAASNTFGFQVISRDSSGIKVRIHKPSHLEDPEILAGLKSGSMSLRHLAAKTASGLDEDAPPLSQYADPCDGDPREETWTILAVNKFDSTRKRMSILLRSPPELGNLPILFCKGADSAMLEPGVCATSSVLQQGDDMQVLSSVAKPTSISERERDVSNLTTVSEGEDDDRVDVDGWELAQMLGIQAHLGDFASEGLRTLVLGMKVLTESECTAWLDQFNKASVSLTDRANLLTEAAQAIERDLHICGATAIEDKLQKGVPKTIATLEKAGIKLWVLTGDKRETAVEIGYSTHVLTPRMHVTECGDYGKHYVRTQMSMEFMRLVKKGRLPEYQKASIQDEGPKTRKRRWENFMFSVGKVERKLGRAFLVFWIGVLNLFGFKDRASTKEEVLKKSIMHEETIKIDFERRKLVREKAESTIKRWLESDEGKEQQNRAKQAQTQAAASDDDLSLTSEETPLVFNRAASAKGILNELKTSGRLSQSELRKLSLAHLTVQQGGGGGENEEPLVDEDTLSLASFFPGSKDDLAGNFDKKRRTILERMFAIDKQVRKGQLRKHVHPEKLAQGQPTKGETHALGKSSEDGPRALVIEGAALKHLLGDPLLEEILFAVASSCEAVIACRVSPQQKALLVNLVRQNVNPEPITLAIGDGANDVGMIQEAHVGIGISGKEGKQAVNASDFAISQFRFLEDLVLIHGRWDFFRLSTVILFSFYKNAVMAGTLVVFTARTVYSGTPLFDEWLIAMLNFVAGMPIIMTGLFDRCLSKEYVRAHPEVYKASRDNELMTPRTLLRWTILVFVHIFTLYYFTVPQQSFGGGITPAWNGLMRNDSREVPGDGEGGDLKSVGTVTYTCLIILLAYKVLYETRSIVHGRWPSFTCSKERGEGWHSRLHYTWIGVIWFSIFFYLFAIFVYERIGRNGASAYSRFVDTTSHVLATRSLSWMLITFVPIMGIIFDVTGKVYANLFFPTQTQIHLEMESKLKQDKRKQHFLETGMRMRRGARQQASAAAAANLGGTDNV